MKILMKIKMNNTKIYENIAKEHLKEDPKYYSKIKKYGL